MKKVLIGIAIILGIVCTITLGLLACYTITNNNAKDKKEELNNEKEIKENEENNGKEIKEDNEPSEEIETLTLGDYEITVEEEKYSDGSIKYGTIINTKTKEKWDIQSFSNDDSIFVIFGSRGRGIYNKKEGYIIKPKYNDVSCFFHSDESYYVCVNSYTTIVDGSKLMSLKTGKTLVEVDEISEINTNFIAKKDNKRILYTSDGKELLKKDYIGHLYDNETDKTNDLGYITFENNVMKVYSDNMNEIKLNLDKDKKYSVSDESRMWTSEDILVNVDLQNNEYFTYTGKEYTGYQYTFIENPCYGGPLSIYVIDNNKLVKLNKATLNEEYGYECF